MSTPRLHNVDRDVPLSRDSSPRNVTSPQDASILSRILAARSRGDQSRAVNLYGYVSNNPMSWRDRSGLLGEGTIAGLALGPETAGLSIPAGLAWDIGEAMVGTAADGWASIGLWGWMHDPNRPWNQPKPQTFCMSKKHPPATLPPAPPIPSDPAESPGEGWKWEGKGEPGSREGSWTNPETGESLHSDLDNPAHDPHWDYIDQNGDKWRCPAPDQYGPPQWKGSK